MSIFCNQSNPFPVVSSWTNEILFFTNFFTFWKVTFWKQPWCGRSHRHLLSDSYFSWGEHIKVVFFVQNRSFHSKFQWRPWLTWLLPTKQNPLYFAQFLEYPIAPLHLAVIFINHSKRCCQYPNTQIIWRHSYVWFSKGNLQKKITQNG